MTAYTLILHVAAISSGEIKQLDPSHPQLATALEQGHVLMTAELLKSDGKLYWVILMQILPPPKKPQRSIRSTV